jgi:hypothetical protein
MSRMYSVSYRYRCTDLVRRNRTFFFTAWFFSIQWRNSPQWARASSLSRLHDHTQTHHTRWDSSGRVISPSQRPLADSTEDINIHAPSGIRTHNPSKQAAADPRVRPRGHQARLFMINRKTNNVVDPLVRPCWPIEVCGLHFENRCFNWWGLYSSQFALSFAVWHLTNS